VVTDALSLAPAVLDAQLAEPAGYVHPSEWHGRRARHFGASDVAALFVAYDVEDPSVLGSYARKNGKRLARGPYREPRIILERAGIVPPLAGRGSGRQLGLDRERRLIYCWRDLVARGQAGEGAAQIDASTIAYVPDVLPVEIAPIVDRACPALAVTPDCWARDVWGDLGAVEAKCSMHPFSQARGSTPAGVRRSHVLQLHAQSGVIGATWGAVTEGEGWGAEWRDLDGGPAGRIRTWPVSVERALVETIRQVVREAWAAVERLRAMSKEEAA
jgi:hypothetical protein